MDLEKWSREAIIRHEQWRQCGHAGDVSSPAIIRLAKKYIGDRVLDVGAGSGALINLIPHAVGLDLVCKHPRVIVGDVSHMPFVDESFDTIFATELLEHLDDETLNQGLTEITRVLRPGGATIMTMPYKENLIQNMVLCPKCGAKFQRVGHVQVFDEDRIKGILESKRLKIIKAEALPLGFMARHQFLKNFRWLLRRLLRRLGILSSLNLFVVAVKE